MDNRNHLKPMVRRKNPSFSSSLLDEIYRSFDDQTTPPATGKKMEENADMMIFNKVASRKKSGSAEYHFPHSFCLNSSSSASSDSSSETSKSFGLSKLAVGTSHGNLKNEHGGGSVKTRSKALKMYDDFKKSKPNQPVSPGSRLSTFLNSLFTSTANAKKTKFDKTKFTRSCFSKTPSSCGKSRDGVKRSVRFYPVIMDEDRRYNEEIRENARQVLNKYEKKIQECKMMNDDEDDCESCASSDLFELHNLHSVTATIQRYGEELPVYETTSMDANRAIAHALIN